MRSFFYENRILAVIVAIALLASVMVDVGRMNIEKDAKTYDVILDYQELLNMSKQSDHDIDWWLAEFKSMGIVRVGLSEESLIGIMENHDMPVSAVMMSTVLEKADWRSDYDPDFLSELDERGFDEFDVLVEVHSTDAFKFISDALVERFSDDKYLIYASQNGGTIVLDGNSKDALYTEKYKNLNSKGIGFTEQDKISSSKILYVNLGLMQDKVDRIEAAGMEVIPRTAGYNGWNGWKYADAVLAGYERLETVPEYAIFSGEETIGFDGGTERIIDYLNENNVVVGLIENTTQLQNIMQDGMDSIVPATGFNAVRVFTVWGYIQNRYQYYGYEGSEEIENTLFRAIVERNIRVIYYKPMKEYKDNHTYITDPEEYHQLFDNLSRRVAEHGFSMGKASVMPYYQVAFIGALLMAIGCVAAAVMLLAAILPAGRKVHMALLMLGIAAAAGIYTIMAGMAPLIFSFASAVIFACMAVVYIMKQSKHYAESLNNDEKLYRIVVKGIMTLGIAVLVALAGGMMTAAQISGTSHMLEIDIFRGVKLSQLLPLAFYPIAYLAYFGYGKMKKQPGRLEFNDLKDMMNSSIKIWMVVIGMIGIAVGVYYILRTGHDSEIMPSTFEMLMRNTLESDLIARPRTKEFLFAFPAVMMLVYTSIRGFKIWPIIFGLASVVGMTSVINTFMHIRTPMYLGLARTGYSVLFGIAAGIIGMLIFEAVHKFYKHYERRRLANE